MASFDVVSKVDWHEVDNALDQALREVGQRYDFKGSNTRIERKEGEIEIESADDYKVGAAYEVLQGKLAKRKVPLGALKVGAVEPASGGRARQTIDVRSGVETEIAREIVKKVKATKIKVQVADPGRLAAGQRQEARRSAGRDGVAARRGSRPAVAVRKPARLRKRRCPILANASTFCRSAARRTRSTAS